MATFKYKALDFEGKEVTGTIDAIDEMAAVAMIKDICPVITKITKTSASGNALSKDLGGKGVDLKVLSVMCSQFSIILRAGMSIGLCVELIKDQTEDKKLKAILEKVHADVVGGTSLAIAFANRGGKALPTTFVETVRAGELAGKLDTAFETLNIYFDKQNKTKSKVKNALTYPIFVIVISIIVLIVVMIKVVPTIISLFDEFQADIPIYTKLLINSSLFVRNHIVIIVVLAAAIIIAYRVAYNKPKGRIAIDGFKLKFPGLGRIATLRSSAVFATTFGTLLKSGLTVTHAIAVTAKTIENAAVAEETAGMVSLIEEGRLLGDVMRRSKYYPKTLIEMVAVGEQSGELEETLTTIGEFYDSEAQTATDAFLAKLEPTLLCIIAALAGYFVLSIYMPIFQIYGMM